MNRRGTILVVDDNRNILTSLNYLLRDYFLQVVTISSPAGIPTMLQQNNPDVVLLDMNFTSGLNTGNEGLYWLREIKRLRPQTQVVLFTAYADINLAVTGLKEGATDFVVKPWDNARLVQTLLDALEKAHPTGRNKSKKSEVTKLDRPAMFWGNSPAIKPLKQIVEKVSVTDANILITGENGTGKDMLAHEVHQLSNRRGGPFVSVDMGAISESLFESELFGHVKGAFTDAITDRQGRFEAANGGTLFLDEIANLPIHMQPKLLTVLQNRSYIKVGSNLPQPADIRLICATNRDLNDMVKNGGFREDLLYRINTIHLHLPPLRDRLPDIAPLAELFLQQYAKQYGRHIERLTPSAIEKLQNHLWPGNIRELQHCMEKAVIMQDGEELQADTIEISHSQELPSAHSQSVESPVQTIDQMERSLILKAIEQNCGNMSAVALQLGISRQTLYNKMKRYGI